MNRKILVIASALGLMVAFVAAVLIYNGKQEAAARQLAEANRAALMRIARANARQTGFAGRHRRISRSRL